MGASAVMKSRMRGVTLVELIVSIVIISIAVVSVLGVLATVSSNSASAMVQQQAVSIASSYLNEVLQKSFADPNGGGVEASRNLFDNVGDYNGLFDAGARDQFGNAIADLSQFQVTVNVSQGALTSLTAAQVWLVDVTVTHPSIQPVVLSGYRTQY
jgi:MSHA pilin protein MshD